jgi:tRNA pseudouridine55 synthase
MREAINGLLVLDKPQGITSRAAVDRAQRWFPRGTRIGHTGTLDPLATGVLVLCLGVATRLTEYVQRMAKTYRTEILLGARSDTDDADGVVTQVPVVRPPTLDVVRTCLATFVGAIEQVPPSYSAAKVTGRRAYDLARAGQEVALEARTVRIDAIDILVYDFPRLEIEVRCGKGTYIRSLARDVGEKLGCGGLVQFLRRTTVGPFTADRAVSLDADAATARASLHPLSAALAELPTLTLPSSEATRLRHGQVVSLPVDALRNPGSRPGECAVVDLAGKLVGVGTLDPQRGVVLPAKMLPLG